MLRMLRFVVGVSLLLAFVWCGATIKLGKHSLFGHLGRIWQSEETRDLIDGTKETAGPTFTRFRNGVERGLASETTHEGADVPNNRVGE